MREKWDVALGLTIRKKRIDKRMLQSDFAKRLGISQTYLSLLESGRREIKFNLLRRISDELGIKASEFLRISEERYEKLELED